MNEESENPQGDPSALHEHTQVASGDTGPPRVLVGLVGQSPITEESQGRGRRWRLYLSQRLDCYVEFWDADRRGEPALVTDPSVAVGTQVTQVRVSPDAQLDFTYTRSESLRGTEQFDLDIRMQAARTTTQPVEFPYRTISGKTCQGNPTCPPACPG